ncbi:MAG: alpha/beta fold hydrolase [Elainellaceae cyanobacterium]
MLQNALPPSARLLRSPEAVALLKQIEHRVVSVTFTPSSRPVAVPTAVVHHPASGFPTDAGPPLLLLPGFDSSLLEFRSLLPRLTSRSVWALDTLGFGFTAQPAATPINRLTIRQHLYRSWQLIDRPVALVGASLGGAIAMDFALAHPACVDRLILINSVGFSGHFPLGPLLFSPLDDWGAEWLRLRKRAFYQAVSALPWGDRGREAALCASIHQERPDWRQAILSFTKSGGYGGIDRHIHTIRQPTLVLWGENDDVLGMEDAEKFERAIPHSRLIKIDAGFHTPHLTNPRAVADAIQDFLK